MIDLQEQVTRVWHPDVRTLALEASRCYGIGAHRAAITLTWVAVCTDLIGKISRLADDGETIAAAARARIESAQAQGLSATGVQTMQAAERELVSTAVELELIDTITARDLERLREDRHLCVHPSLRGLGEPYEPRSETARAHLAAALDGLLTLPPTQGRAAVDRFKAHVADPYFTATAEHLAQTFYDRVRPAARRRIIDLASKHALLELQVLDPPGTVGVADAMAASLPAFAQRDRAAVRDALARSMDRMSHLESAALVRAVARLGELEVLWEVVDEPIVARMGSLVGGMHPGPPYGELNQEDAGIISLVAIPAARARLPQLVSKFAGLPTMQRAMVMSRRVLPYFVPHVAPLLAEAGGWRMAEALTRDAVLPYGRLLSEEDLADVLRAWAENSESRQAGGMLALATELYRATAHLHGADVGVWRNFLAEVRAREGPESYYQYTELEAVLGPGP